MNFLYGYGLGAALATLFAVGAIIFDFSYWTIVPIFIVGIFFMIKGRHDANLVTDEGGQDD